jgi:hypothetical protein
MRCATLVIGLVALSCTTAVQAKVAPARLAELIAAADVIVLGTDSTIDQGRKWDVAHFKVEEVLKGAPPTDLLYLASPTWACDIATAKPGERSLLLLSLPESGFRFGAPPRTRKGQTVYQITWSGRGRLPITQVAGEELVTVWTGDVLLPDDMPTVPGPEPEFSFIQRVPLSAIRTAVEQAASQP